MRGWLQLKHLTLFSENMRGWLPIWIRSHYFSNCHKRMLTLVHFHWHWLLMQSEHVIWQRALCWLHPTKADIICCGVVVAYKSISLSKYQHGIQVKFMCTKVSHNCIQLLKGKTFSYTLYTFTFYYIN